MSYFGQDPVDILKSSDSEVRTILAGASKRFEEHLSQVAMQSREIARGILIQDQHEKSVRAVEKLMLEASEMLSSPSCENISRYVAARLLANEIVDFRNRSSLFNAVLLNSIESDVPITFYLSRCLRYYYPEGRLAVIDHVGDQEYLSLTGNVKTKTEESVIEEIKHDLELPSLLMQLGFKCEVVMPLMDHELRRPVEMNTSENRSLAQHYIQSLADLVNTHPETSGLNVSVLSGTEIFDFGSAEQESFFNSVKYAILYSNQNDFGVANYMFEAEVGRVTGVFRDSERLERYNQNEFPRERVLFNTCDGAYMAKHMTELAPRSAGVLALMPKGGEYISKVYESNPNLCTYMPR